MLASRLLQGVGFIQPLLRANEETKVKDVMKLLQGEGWVELLCALIAISQFVVWVVTVMSSRMQSTSLWDHGRLQQSSPTVQQVVTTPDSSSDNSQSGVLAVR